MPSFQAKPLLLKHTDSPRNDLPAGLWVKCKSCEQMIFQTTLEEALHVCPHCDHHHPLTARQRIASLSDKNSFQEHDADLASVDALNFADDGSYARKIKETMAKTGLKDAVVCGNATLNNLPFALGVMDFRFFGASMGSVVGEKLTRLIEWATAARYPLVIVTA
ncbi:MAG: acetyl-CoA carboxylase carboxyl transferase subunit beta, partial [Lentisphaeria bacterium]|nr:acetyl-CoA carboxylase carboxyl transferase subunit beta [Lentisphaeria bacterium]